MDFPYYGNLHSADKMLPCQIIPDTLLYIATYLLQKPPFSELWTPKFAPTDKINTNFPLNVNSLDSTGINELKIFAVLEDFMINLSILQRFKACLYSRSTHTY